MIFLYKSEAEELLYFPDFIIQKENAFQELASQVEWQQNKIRVYGKWYDEPRLTAWFGPAYKYSSIEWPERAMPFFLQEIKNQIEKVAGFSFNAVLLNYYRDERDSMGWHSDDEPEMNQTMIASLSLGAERVFKFRHKATKQKLQVKLTSGSLLLMKNFQENWQHAIDKSSKPIGGRINLTFRQII